MKINILTIMPEIFNQIFDYGVLGKAKKNNIWSYNIINIRDFAKDKRKTIDDTVYGGGAGMLFKPDILSNALDSIKTPNQKIIHMSPKGIKLNQELVVELSKLESITIINSRYEGVDQRFIDKYNIIEVSIGDYILTGGEIASMVLIDSCIRVLESVIGNDQSLNEESFSNFLLEYDQFTKPKNFKGLDIPEILISGNHEKIKKFHLQNAIEKTRKNRKDLWFKFIKHSLTCNYN